MSATPHTDAAWSFAFTASEFSAASAARQMRDKCAELETELAAEREKVRVLRSALERRHDEQSYYCQYVEDALAATKEASK